MRPLPTTIIRASPAGRFPRFNYSYYDPAPPKVEIRPAGPAVTLSWTEFEGPSWRIVSQPKLDRLASWEWVTNDAVRLPGPFYISNLVTLQLDVESRFFRLLRRE